MTAAARARPVPAGRAANITQRQDQPEHFDRLLAYSRRYIVGQRWRTARTMGTTALAIAAPWIALTEPGATDLLAAIAAGWLVLGRTLLTWFERRSVVAAVEMQELYDTKLFFLPWNGALAGPEPAPEDIVDAARHIRRSRRPNYMTWFSVALDGIPWPADVLLCQRQSIVWGRRDHRAYSVTLAIVTTAVLAGGVAAAVARDLTLGEYLIKIFLPTSPALLDASELALAHWHHADGREHVEHDIHEMWARYKDRPDDLTIDDCRRIQDASFVLRLGAPRVAKWFYVVRRKASNEVTVAGTSAMIAEG